MSFFWKEFKLPCIAFVYYAALHCLSPTELLVTFSVAQIGCTTLSLLRCSLVIAGAVWLMVCGRLQMSESLLLTFYDTVTVVTAS